MKQNFISILFLLFLCPFFAWSTPADGLKEIPLTGLNTADGYTFHLYSADGKLNRGFSEVFIALTDVNNTFVTDFTVSDFRPLMDMGMSKHSTPVGAVEKVDGKALYKTWFSFLMYTGQMGGSWTLSFSYTIGSSTIKSAVLRAIPNAAVISNNAIALNDTATYVGWFKDRHCVGAVTLPLTSSCGIGCGTGAGNMAGCWNGGLGLFIYDPTQTGQLDKATARSDAHFLLFDAASKELVRAFLLSLPSDASGKISIKVTGYRVPNGISANKSESNVPELNVDSVDHQLNAFHLLSLEGVILENQSKSYAGFASVKYRHTQADLAPSNVAVVNNTLGATVSFTPPKNEGNAKSNLKGYKVRVYNKVGEIQNQFTTVKNDTTLRAIDVVGFTANENFSTTVTALYTTSSVEAESVQSSVVLPSIDDVVLPVDDFAADSKWLQSFIVNNVTYYLSIAYPKSIGVGSQTVQAFINRKDDVVKPYPIQEGGFKIVATPFMRSMGHGSAGNAPLLWNATKHDYEGTLNFSMEGDWRVNLKVYDAVADTLVAGSNIDAEGNGSTHFWDVYLTGTTTGISDQKQHVQIYPTLSNGNITIDSPAEAQITVRNVVGKTIGNYHSDGNNTLQLDVPSGLYLVSVQSLGKTFTQKVIIQK